MSKQSRVPSRSPHPYYRKSLPPEHGATTITTTTTTNTTNTSALDTLAPSDGPVGDEPYDSTLLLKSDTCFTPSTASISGSETESGTEADDEKEQLWRDNKFHLSRRWTLPAPPQKKGQWEIDDDEEPRLRDGASRSGTTTPLEKTEGDLSNSAEFRPKSGKLGGRKKIVFLRRGIEVMVMLVLGLTVCLNANVREELPTWKKELASSVLGFAFTISLQPLYSLFRNLKTVSLPRMLDPSSLLYPIFLPPFVALSLTPYTWLYITPTLICSLCSIPPASFPPTILADPSITYVLSLIPLLVSDKIPPFVGEQFLYIPLLHSNLVQLGYEYLIPSLTTTETRLLATSLISVYLNAVSSQMVILKVILWWTGGTFMIAGKHFMEKEIDFERSLVIARGRMWTRDQSDRRDRRSRSAHEKSIKSSGDESGSPSRHFKRRRRLQDVIPGEAPKNPFVWRYLYALPVYTSFLFVVVFFERPYIAEHAFSGVDPFVWALGYLFSGIPLYHTILEKFDFGGMHTSSIGGDVLTEGAYWGPNFRLLLAAFWLLAVIIGVLFVITLGKGVRVPIEKLGLEFSGPGWLGLAEVARGKAVEVDTRRKVFHGMVVGMFLPSIFLDPPFVSTAFIVTLAIFLILDIFRATLMPPVARPLAVFLAPYVDGRDLRGPIVVSHVFLLVGCAIPLWLSLAGMTPAGRSDILDMESHPDITPFGSYWLAPARDLAMIAGIICVGMGDAAASLIGRRFGKHKWGWSGGKSLEGSLAFTGAVGLGLLVAKVLMTGGMFEAGKGGIGRGGIQALKDITLRGTMYVLWKSLFAGGIGSLVEAVITGGNDNVIVPVVLWLAIRGLNI